MKAIVALMSLYLLIGAAFGTMQKPLGMHWDIECYGLFDGIGGLGTNKSANALLDLMQQLKNIIAPTGLLLTWSCDLL
jgi:hypothetical protein